MIATRAPLDPCGGCIRFKRTPLTHTRCEKCGHWREMNQGELAKVARRHRG